jgi:aryl-alcohol dehydrogenase-like predicted oxidoreductase
LSSGLLTGKYQGGIPEDSRGSIESLSWLRDGLTNPERLAKVAALEPLAQDMGATLAQFSLAWCLQNPQVSTVITGASRVSQVHENMQAIKFIDRFTPEVLAEIDKIFA